MEDALETVMEQTDSTSESPTYSIAYSDGTLTVPVRIATSEEFAQKYPSNLIQYLYDTYGEEAQEEENRLFATVSYDGYSVTTSGEGENAVSQVSFEMEIQMLPNELPVEETAAAEEAPAEEAAAE